jgi:hypothetical protein
MIQMLLDKGCRNGRTVMVGYGTASLHFMQDEDADLE